MRWVGIEVKYICMTWCDDLRLYENVWYVWHGVMNELCVIGCSLTISCDDVYWFGNVY